jgi:predicted dehydrogenase
MSTIKSALLSFGMSGRVFHAPFIEQHPGFQLLGSWERSSKNIAQHYPDARSYDSLEALLADETVDLVVVNTPTYTHYDYAKQALESGKHVVVEKAFAGNAAEAVELRDLAAKMGRKLAVFQNRRWDSDFLAIRDVLQQGVLGDIVEANLGYLRYDPNLSPKTHKEIPSSGSGILKDLGSHVIDQALVLFGMPDAVFADIGITRDDSKVEDYFDILLRYADKRVHVRGGYFYKQQLPEFSLFGKRGSFTKSRADVQEPQLDRGMKPDDPEYGKEPDSKAGRLVTDTVDEAIVSPRGNYAAFYDGMYESITNDWPEPVTADDGVRVMQIIDAAWQSHNDGRLISL